MQRHQTHYVKYLTDEEFRLVMRAAAQRDSQPFLICLKVMAYLGLRVSEATSLKRQCFDQQCESLVYEDIKTHAVHHKLVPIFFSAVLREYIAQCSHEFVEGFMFPPLHNRTSKYPHLQASTYRDFFMKFRRSNALDAPYFVTSNGKPLYRISPHTLKHYCAWKVYVASGNDLVFTKDFLGHKEMKHTIHYIQHRSNQLKQAEVLQKAFA